MPGLERVPIGEITLAVETAHKDLGNQSWPWNYAETNVLIPAVYSTGTVSIASGSATVTGTSTVWDPTWYGRRMRVGNSNLDYLVSSIDSPTQITLAQPLSLPANIVDSGYTLYQDTYPYPTDYIFGSDVGLFQPLIRIRVAKIPRYRFEQLMNAGLRSFSTDWPQFYCDHGEELTTTSPYYGRFRFRLAPPVSGANELRLVYHQMAPDIASFGDKTTLPEGYDEIVELQSASKLYDLKSRPGESLAAKMLCLGKIKLLKRQVATQTVDNTPNMNDELPNSSMSYRGLTISRMP